MKITFLGTGTSQGVPVIACDCYVCQSSDERDKRLRSAILVETEGKTLVVDTGPDFRCQMLTNKVKSLDAVLLTHAHKDHIAGLDDVRAFNFKQKKNMPIYASEDTISALKREFYYAFLDHDYPGLPRFEIHSVEAGHPFSIENLSVMPIQVMHHKMPVLGFRIKDFTYITDAKTVDDENFERIKGTEVLVVNALQESTHLSHLTLSEALKFIEKVNPKKAFLTHISHRFDRHENILKKLPDNVWPAYDGLVVEL